MKQRGRFERRHRLPRLHGGKLALLIACLIQTALSRLIKNKTVLVIAHRMRTVAGADKIVVLADGVVAEQGSPAELYKKNGIYTHMVDIQTKSQEWKI